MTRQLARYVIGHPTVEHVIALLFGHATQVSEFYHAVFSTLAGVWLLRPGPMFEGLPGLQAVVDGHPPEPVLGVAFVAVGLFIFAALWLDRPPDRPYPRARLWAMIVYTFVMFTVLSSLWAVWATVLFPVLLYFVANPLHLLCRIWMEVKYSA